MTDERQDWKQVHANEAEKALVTPLVQDVIEELLDNLGTDSALVRCGITKVASYAAQVARAQALGFDPELLRLSPDEADAQGLAKARMAVAHGKPVFRADERGVTRLD